MPQQEIERDLAFIKRTMELAGRYRNIPPLGYLAIGLLGLLGAAGSYLLLGPNAGQLSAAAPREVRLLAGLWSAILIASLISMVLLAHLRARRLGIVVWNSLAARMVCSQVPLFLASGLLTLGLVTRGQTALVPALWLLQFGALSYSFSYFTGLDHKLQGIIFLVLGGTALVAPSSWSIPLLGIGFGGVHLIFGLIRLRLDTTGR